MKLVCVTKFAHSQVEWISALISFNLSCKFRFTLLSCCDAWLRRCTVVRHMRKSLGKWKIRPPPCKIVTPKNFILKLCTRDYVGEFTRHANFGFNRYTGGFSPDRRNITTLWLFWLSCPVLALPFFSILRPGRTAGPILRFMAQTTCFRARIVFLGVRTMGDHIWGKYAPKTPQKWAWINNFQPKRQNIKIAISPKL